MPFTPFHWGPSSWIGLLFTRRINIFALLIASVIIDIEPFLVILLNLNYPLHGYLHTYLIGTLIAVITSIVIYRFRELLDKCSSFFRLPQNNSFKVILFSCLLGVYSHVFLDSFIHTDIKPFFPFKINPFYGFVSFTFVHFACGAFFILGILLYGIKRSHGRSKIVLKVIHLLVVVILVLFLAVWYFFEWSLTVHGGPFRRSVFDDGPFSGSVYTKEIINVPDTTIKLGTKYILEGYNFTNETSILVLRDTDGKLIRAVNLTVSNVEKYSNCEVEKVQLIRARPTLTGYQAQGLVLWTYGNEAANFYFDKMGKLEKFYLSW